MRASAAGWQGSATASAGEVPSMKIRLLRCVFGCAAALALLPASAQAQAAAAQAAACQAPEYDGPLLLNRQERITQYEGLGEHCLKRLVEECNSAASRQLLDAGSAFACSIGYEALLKRGFGGDFQAMLAWWRNRAAAPTLN
jgi:hypothetical protein